MFSPPRLALCIEGHQRAAARKLPGAPRVAFNRRLFAVLAAAALPAVVTMSAPLVSSQTLAPPGIASLTAPDEAAAVAAARAQGRPVEALSDRTESSQTFANPTGTLTLNESVVPVRVHRADGSWVPVDRTLREGVDGRLAPVASEVDLSFSGGGPGPLARIAKGGGQLTLDRLQGHYFSRCAD